jgi:hypothetical protein
MCLLRGNTTEAYPFRPPLDFLLGRLLRKDGIFQKGNLSNRTANICQSITLMSRQISQRISATSILCHSDVVLEFSYLVVSHPDTALAHLRTLENSRLQ